jgi:hypothetical protein
VRHYTFHGVIQLGRDFVNGFFQPAFEQPVPEAVDGLGRAVVLANDLLVDALDGHRQVCDKGKRCFEAENVIAYLCHSLGVHSDKLLKVNDLPTDYDSRCPECDAYATHKAATQAARSLNARNN